MKYLSSLLNDMLVCLIFILATKIAELNVIYGTIAFIIGYLCLDLHSYIDKKLNYPNNLFIH